MLVGNGSYLLAVDKNDLKSQSFGPNSEYFFVNFLYRARGGRRLKLSKSVKAHFQWPFLASWLVSFGKKEDGKECEVIGGEKHDQCLCRISQHTLREQQGRVETCLRM